MKILADNVVVYEMCEFGTILDQFKLMASLDYASLADNVTRMVSTLAITMPETFDMMDQVYAAGECAFTVAKDQAAQVQQQVENVDDQWEEFGTDEDGKTQEGDPSFWQASLNDFAADKDTAVEQGLQCMSLINEYELGEMSGKLFS